MSNREFATAVWALGALGVRLSEAAGLAAEWEVLRRRDMGAEDLTLTLLGIAALGMRPGAGAMEELEVRALEALVQCAVSETHARDGVSSTFAPGGLGRACSDPIRGRFVAAPASGRSRSSVVASLASALSAVGQPLSPAARSEFAAAFLGDIAQTSPRDVAAFLASLAPPEPGPVGQSPYWSHSEASGSSCATAWSPLATTGPKGSHREMHEGDELPRDRPSHSAAVEQEGGVGNHSIGETTAFGGAVVQGGRTVTQDGGTVLQGDTASSGAQSCDTSWESVAAAVEWEVGRRAWEFGDTVQWEWAGVILHALSLGREADRDAGWLLAGGVVEVRGGERAEGTGGERVGMRSLPRRCIGRGTSTRRGAVPSDVVMDRAVIHRPAVARRPPGKASFEVTRVRWQPQLRRISFSRRAKEGLTEESTEELMKEWMTTEERTEESMERLAGIRDGIWWPRSIPTSWLCYAGPPSALSRSTPAPCRLAKSGV